jgi:hypothetical protein
MSSGWQDQKARQMNSLPGFLFALSQSQSRKHRGSPDP